MMILFLRNLHLFIELIVLKIQNAWLDSELEMVKRRLKALESQLSARPPLKS
jgi:hypothetical protein